MIWAGETLFVLNYWVDEAATAQFYTPVISSSMVSLALVLGQSGSLAVRGVFPILTIFLFWPIAYAQFLEFRTQENRLRDYLQTVLDAIPEGAAFWDAGDYNYTQGYRYLILNRPDLSLESPDKECVWFDPQRTEWAREQGYVLKEVGRRKVRLAPGDTEAKLAELLRRGYAAVAVRDEATNSLSSAIRSLLSSHGVDIDALDYRGSMALLFRDGRLLAQEFNNEGPARLNPKVLHGTPFTRIFSAGFDFGDSAQILPFVYPGRRGLNVVNVLPNGVAAFAFDTYAKTAPEELALNLFFPVQACPKGTN